MLKVNMAKLMLFFVLSTIQLSAQASSYQGMKEIDLQKDWGIQPVHLRITADGYMMEFRYKVLDVDKATILSHRKDFPFLLSMKSQAKFSVPYGSTVGYLKSNRKFLKKGKNYITMFSNINRHMLPGDKVRIQVKDQVSAELTIDK